MYCNAKFYTQRSRPMSEFSCLEAFVVQTLFLDLKLMLNKIGYLEGRWVRSDLVRGETRGRKRRGKGGGEEKVAMREEEP